MKFLSFISNSDAGRILGRIFLLAVLAFAAQTAVFRLTKGAEKELIDSTFRVGPMVFEDLEKISFAHLDSIARSNPDVLFLCDSTVMGNIEDADQRLTPVILQELLPDTTIGYLFYPGWTLEIYDVLLRYLADRGARPKIVVAPVNIRSFGVPWYRYPAMQFPRLKFSLEHGSPWSRPFIKPLLIFKAGDMTPITTAEFGQAIAAEYQESVRRFGAPIHAAPGGRVFGLMSSYCTYVFLVNEDHPLLDAMQSLSVHARESGAKLLLYAAPIDLQHLEETLGGAAVEAVRENIARIHQAGIQFDVRIMETAYALQNGDFLPVGVTASHLRDTGRRRLAEYLAIEITGHLEGVAVD